MIELTGSGRSSVNGIFGSIEKWKAAYMSAIEDGYGELFVDNAGSPNVAVLFYGGLVIYAGDSSSKYARDIIRVFPEQPLILGYSDQWNKLLEIEFGQRIEEQYRYHLCFGGLDIGKIKEIERNTSEKAEPCQNGDIEFLESLFGWEHQKFHYKNSEDFLENAFPFIKKQGKNIITGASAFIRSQKHAECQINTIESERRKGYGKVVGAAFILKCIENDVEIPWDAANQESVALGKSLGYQKVEKYKVYSMI